LSKKSCSSVEKIVFLKETGEHQGETMRQNPIAPCSTAATETDRTIFLLIHLTCLGLLRLPVIVTAILSSVW